MSTNLNIFSVNWTVETSIRFSCVFFADIPRASDLTVAFTNDSKSYMVFIFSSFILETRLAVRF